MLKFAFLNGFHNTVRIDYHESYEGEYVKRERKERRERETKKNCLRGKGNIGKKTKKKYILIIPNIKKEIT